MAIENVADLYMARSRELHWIVSRLAVFLYDYGFYIQYQEGKMNNFKFTEGLFKVGISVVVLLG